MLTRDKLNSRKLFVALFTESLSAILLMRGLLAGNEFVTITITIIGAYMASQGYVDGKSTK